MTSMVNTNQSGCESNYAEKFTVPQGKLHFMATARISFYKVLYHFLRRNSVIQADDWYKSFLYPISRNPVQTKI